MRLNHVTLTSADPGRALPFYEGLGLTTIVVDRDPEGKIRYARLTFPDGDSTLSLERAEGPPPVGRGGAVVFFECEDLDARVAALTAAGYVFDGGPETKPWLWREARLRDPDGYALCLFRAGFYRLDPPWRIVPASAPSSAPAPSPSCLPTPLPSFLAENNRGYVEAPIPSGRDTQIGAFLEQVLEQILEQVLEQAIEKEVGRGGEAAARAAHGLGPPYTATLLAYAERMASLAVRTRTVGPARLGVLAIALAWTFALDVRPAIPVLGVLFDGIRRAGGDPGQVFREIARLGPPDVAPVLIDFLTRPDLDEIAEEMGFVARQDRDGFRYRRTWGPGRVDPEDEGEKVDVT